MLTRRGKGTTETGEIAYWQMRRNAPSQSIRISSTLRLDGGVEQNKNEG
jgi:hypothetical protein